MNIPTRISFIIASLIPFFLSSCAQNWEAQHAKHSVIVTPWEIFDSKEFGLYARIHNPFEPEKPKRIRYSKEDRENGIPSKPTTVSYSNRDYTLVPAKGPIAIAWGDGYDVENPYTQLDVKRDEKSKTGFVKVTQNGKEYEIYVYRNGKINPWKYPNNLATLMHNKRVAIDRKKRASIRRQEDREDFYNEWGKTLLAGITDFAEEKTAEMKRAEAERIRKQAEIRRQNAWMYKALDKSSNSSASNASNKGDTEFEPGTHFIMDGAKIIGTYKLKNGKKFDHKYYGKNNRPAKVTPE